MIELHEVLMVFLSVFAGIGIIFTLIFVVANIYSVFENKTISFEVTYKNEAGELIFLKNVKKISLLSDNKIIIKAFNEKTKTYEIHYINEWDFINGVRLYEA